MWNQVGVLLGYVELLLDGYMRDHRGMRALGRSFVVLLV